MTCMSSMSFMSYMVCTSYMSVHVTHTIHVTHVSTCHTCHSWHVSHVIYVHVIHDLILNKACCLEWGKPQDSNMWLAVLSSFLMLHRTMECIVIVHYITILQKLHTYFVGFTILVINGGGLLISQNTEFPPYCNYHLYLNNGYLRLAEIPRTTNREVTCNGKS